MNYDPFDVAVQSFQTQYVLGLNACTYGYDDLTWYYDTWWTGDTQVATADMNQITGVGVGSTSNFASGTIPTGGDWESRHCPFASDTPSGGVNVLTATVQLRAGNDQHVSSNDLAKVLYTGTVGTDQLGMLAAPPGPSNGCYGGNELVGAVQPSNSGGPVTVKRTLISQGCYQGSSPISCGSGLGDDTGTWITTNPQDGGGNVYNLDLPGVTFNTSGSTPIVRIRYNFLAFAVGPSGTSISNYVSYYVRLSCYQDSSGVAHFSYDVNSDDNKIGLGTTSTSLNLN